MAQEENTKYETPVSEEIDLRFLYRKIKQLFSTLWNSIIGFIVNAFIILRKRWGLIFIFCLLGAGTGAGLFYTTRPIYISTLVCSSTILNNELCADMVFHLNLLIKDRTPEALAKILNINVPSVKSIKELKFYNYNEKLKKKYDNKDTIVLGLPFKIKAYTYNNTVFDTLQTALVNYFENNKYSLKRKEIKMANIKRLKEKLKKDVHQLDSLKVVIASNMSSPRGTQTGFVFGQPIDPINMFREGIALLKEDLLLNKELELIDNIQVIQDFAPRDKPDSPRLVRNIVLFGAGSFLLGLIIAFYLERKKLLMRV